MLPNVSLSIIKNVTATLIAKTLLDSLHSRLGFNTIKYFATSPCLKVACKQFLYESGKYKAFQKLNWITVLSNHPTTCYNYL